MSLPSITSAIKNPWMDYSAMHGAVNRVAGTFVGASVVLAAVASSEGRGQFQCATANALIGVNVAILVAGRLSVYAMQAANSFAARVIESFS